MDRMRYERGVVRKDIIERVNLVVLLLTRPLQITATRVKEMKIQGT